MNARDKGGATPLFVACESGHATCAKLLLHAGADVLLRNSAGEAPLYIAALRGEIVVLDALLHHMHEQGICWQVTSSPHPTQPLSLIHPPIPSPVITFLLQQSIRPVSPAKCGPLSLCKCSSAVGLRLVCSSVTHSAHSFDHTCLLRLCVIRLISQVMYSSPWCDAYRMDGSMAMAGHR